MNFGYTRVFEEEQQSSPVREQMLGLVDSDRFLFQDIRNKVYDRSNYLFLRNMLRPGDVLYVDGLDSLGRNFADMAAEWRYLTREVQIDVVVLDDAMQLDSRRFRAMGEVGAQIEQQMLDVLVYATELLHRRLIESQREGISAAQKAGKKFGRPSLQMDWELFDATAQQWVDGEIGVEEACEIAGSTRSSWYKYAKERGFVRTKKQK